FRKRGPSRSARGICRTKDTFLTQACRSPYRAASCAPWWSDRPLLPLLAALRLFNAVTRRRDLDLAVVLRGLRGLRLLLRHQTTSTNSRATCTRRPSAVSTISTRRLLDHRQIPARSA